MPRPRLILVLAGAMSAAAASVAEASCRISNETGTSFTVASGNVSNQRVNAHAVTSIEAGKVQGKSDDGKTVSGACKDGGDLVIREKNGVPLLMPVTRKK